MITIIGGGLSGLATAYFLKRAGKDVTVLEWSRGLGGRSTTRNVGYRTIDAGAQRIDLSPHGSNAKETEARALLRSVLEERGVLPHLKPFEGPILRFDGRSLATAKPVELPDWYYLDGGMVKIAEALSKDITVRTHTRVSDILPEGKTAKLRNQRGETTPTDAIVLTIPAPYALALLLPHIEKHKKLKKITDQLNAVQYEPMIGAMFGTPRLAFKEEFSALFTDDVTAPVFWLSQEVKRRALGVRRDEDSFVLQLGAEVSRDYVLKSDRETFAAIERVFEEVLDIALPDMQYGEIQRWPAAFLESSPFEGEIPKAELGVPLYLAGDYIAGQSSIASAFWSGKLAADKILGEDAAKYILEPVTEQARIAEDAWGAPIPTAPLPARPKKKIPRSPETTEKLKKRKKRAARRARIEGPPERGRGRGGFDRGRPYGGGGGWGGPGGGRPAGQRQYGRPQPGRGGPPRQFNEGDRGGYQQRGGGGGYQQRSGGGGGYQQRGGGGGGYQQRGGGGGGYQQRGGGGGGYQQRSGGYPPREGGYQPREGGYQQRGPGGGGYRDRDFQQRPPYQPSGGYGERRDYQRPQQGGGGYVPGSYRGREQGGPPSQNRGGYGGGQNRGGGGGGYERDYRQPNRGRDQFQGDNRRPPQRGGSLVYSTRNQGGPPGPGGGGGRPPANRPNDNYGSRSLSQEEEERRNLARRSRGSGGGQGGPPPQDDNVGNR